jgi:hypothetical protein
MNLNARFQASLLPERTGAWFHAHPEHAGAVAAITRRRNAATRTLPALTEAVEQHTKTVRKAVSEPEDAPKLDPIDIKAKIIVEVRETLFHSLDDFVTATLKLITGRNGCEGGVADSDDAEGIAE